MSKPVPDPIWPHRWQALRQAIDHTITAAGEDITLRGSPYHQLISSLCTFADHWFTYFYTGFDGEPSDLLKTLSPNKVPELDVDCEYLPDFVMRAITNRVAHDFELIQRAYRQRAHGSSDQVQTLNLVDAWGMDLLKQFGDPPHNGFPGLLATIPRVIAYFNTSAETRLIPYAQAVFVGIPYTAALPATRRDLLVAPHELGHFVYKHGQLGGIAIADALANLINCREPFVKNWIEELFCDVFAIAATPYDAAMVHWVLSMIRDNPTSTYWSDSDTHPVDVVRMFTYLIPAGLSLLFMSAPQAEHDRNTGRKGADERYKTSNDSGNEKTYTLQQLRDVLEQVLTDIAQKLGLTQFSSVFSSITEEMQKVSQSAREVLLESDNLRETLEQSPLHLLLSYKPELSDHSGVLKGYAWYQTFEDDLQNYSEKTSQTSVGSWLLQPDSSALLTPKPLDSLTLNTGSLSCKDWQAILFKGDWITKGPQTGPPVGAWEDVEPDN